MKRNCKLSTCLVILSALSMLMPFMLTAQEPDISERADPEPEEVEEKLFGDEELNEPANTWPKGDYVIVYKGNKNLHLGPTGLWGSPSGQNIWVKKVTPGSPADGKVVSGDVIYGVNGKTFPTEGAVSYHFAMAITEAETKEAGGKLILDIRRDGKFIQVPITLKVMGSFSSTTPWNCEKSTTIVASAEEYMRKGLRPETGMPNNGKYMYGPFHDSVLFLMASGNPELQGLVRRQIRSITKALDAWKAGEKHAFSTEKGWAFCYLSMLFGEYYHRTGDPTVLPYLEGMSNGTLRGDGQPKEDWSPPTGPNRYGLHPHMQMPATMGLVLANEAGLNINKNKLVFDLNYLNHKRAEYGYVKYCGYGEIPVTGRQHEAPEEITDEQKVAGAYSPMNGKLGAAAALYSLVDGYEKAVDMCSVRSVYAFNRTNGGHGGVWFNGFWTPIGAYHAGPEKAQLFMKGQQWWRELYRDHTGSMWQVGNARGKKDTLGTGFAIHRVMHKKRLRMFGAPRSYFFPDPPPSIKPALAAHRNRNYALAEQLTLKLLADGKVPASAKDRVNHFLDSVQTLKKSIEHDLTFTENLLKKGNFALASVELPQLTMVVSPNNPRLKAIARALESTRAKTHSASAIAQAEKDAKEAIQGKGSSKSDSKADFEKDLASIVTLVKDGAKYRGPKFGRRGQTDYPTFSKKQKSQWRMQQVKTLEETPKGWERPDLDDSKWKRAALPITKGFSSNSAALFRTSFEVNNASVFRSLRIRGSAREHRNLTLYLNGEVVAMVLPTGSMVFDLKPESMKLLKRGKNTLAVSIQRGQKTHPFSLRLEGLRKSLQEQGVVPLSLDDPPGLF